MPSGISHMLLVRNLPVEDRPYRYQMHSNSRYVQLGSIAPDIPYGAIADNDIFQDRDEIADLLHFTKTNQDESLSPEKIPLAGFKRVKERREKEGGSRESDALFWFFAGYASHVIGDGVGHPFVMDKVGRYEGSNKAQHRALELGLDVILHNHFSPGEGREATLTSMDSFMKGLGELKYSDSVLGEFAFLIRSVYNKNFSGSEIKEWLRGFSRIYWFFTGNWPSWLRNIEKTSPWVFRRTEDIKGREDDYLTLKKPLFWEENFLKREEIHFIKDIIPRFNILMKEFLDRAWSWVYDGGDPLTSEDLPSLCLDTGRIVADPNNIDMKPILWEDL